MSLTFLPVPLSVTDYFIVPYTFGDQKLEIGCWDTSGQIAFPRMLPLSLANADVLIMLYAIDDAQSLNQSCIETLLPIARTHVPELPIVLVGTKEELLHDISPGAEDAIRAALQLVLQAEKLVGQHNIVAHSLCSAVCGIGVNELFDTAIAAAMQKRTKPKSGKSGFLGLFSKSHPAPTVIPGKVLAHHCLTLPSAAHADIQIQKFWADRSGRPIEFLPQGCAVLGQRVINWQTLAILKEPPAARDAEAQPAVTDRLEVYNNNARKLRFNGVPIRVQLAVQEGPDLTATVHIADEEAAIAPELLLRDLVEDIELDTFSCVVQISPTRIAICAKRTAVCLLDLNKRKFQLEQMLDYVWLMPIYTHTFLAIGGNRLHLIDVRTFGPPRWSQTFDGHLVSLHAPCNMIDVIATKVYTEARRDRSSYLSLLPEGLVKEVLIGPFGASSVAVESATNAFVIFVRALHGYFQVTLQM